MVELAIRSDKDSEAPKPSPIKTLSYSSDDLIPTGVTLLNCACSDTPFGGYMKGTVANVIGDSSSGKTLMVLTGLAEVANDPKFKDYRLIYDDVETANQFNIPYLFGEKAAKRIELGVISDTIETFGNILIQNLIKDKRPFIHVLDSFDALTSKAAIKKAKQRAGLLKAPKKQAGSYNMEKPKEFSLLMSSYEKEIMKNGSLLIVVSQTRQNIGNTFEPVTRSGGNALRFYSTHEMWLTYFNPYKSKKGLQIGSNTGVKVSKNKLTGKKRVISFPKYDAIGIDDIKANIEFLIEEDFLENPTPQTYGLLNKTATKTNLITHIEQNHLRKELQVLVGECWNEREIDSLLDRPRRFE